MHIKNKKAVSPVIATVLLIGIVIVIGMIVFFWFKGLTQESVTKFGDKNIQLVCDDVQFEAEYSLGTLTISNTGTVPIYNFNIKISSAAGFITKDLQSARENDGLNWPKIGLNQGEIFSETITGSIPEISSADEVLVIPILLGESSEGKKTQVCEESHGHYLDLS